MPIRANDEISAMRFAERDVPNLTGNTEPMRVTTVTRRGGSLTWTTVAPWFAQIDSTMVSFTSALKSAINGVASATKSMPASAARPRASASLPRR